METISMTRVLNKLDAYLDRDQYSAAERHLQYWLQEADALGDSRSAFAILNEMVGLYRKLEKQSEAFTACNRLLQLTEETGMGKTVSGATAYVNIATAYKSFGMAETALPLYEQAKTVYEREPVRDARLAALYNNMALALSDLSRYEEAQQLYAKALEVLSQVEGSEPEMAVTHLNRADLLTLSLGAEAAEEAVTQDILQAKELLDQAWETGERNGNFVFTAGKCIPVFRYYGYFLYASVLEERVKTVRSMMDPADTDPTK
ncbi:MAG: tetratricopeptide repeat protein [Lachnospiraceae bacterium]|nr:tetratricopeptide repeat protein [Lachnospiraceae bacterium]